MESLYLKWDIYARQNDITFRRYCRNFIGYGFEIFVETAIILFRGDGKAVSQADLMEELNEVTYIDFGKIKECIDYMVNVELLKKDENGNLFSSRILRDIAELKEESKKSKRTRKPFQKPTVEEVAEYCKQRSNGIDAEEFVSFYGSKDWFVGKSPMKDWKSAVRTWECERKKKLAPKGKTYNPNAFKKDAEKLKRGEAIF